MRHPRCKLLIWWFAFMLAGIFLSGCAGVQPDVPSIENYLPGPAGKNEVEAPASTTAREGKSVPARPKDKPLTLDACVRIALAQNPKVRAAHEGVVAAGEAVGEAQAPYYPEVSLDAGYSHWQKHAFLPTGILKPGIPTIIGPTDDWNADVRARYTLFDFGERRAKLRAAMAQQGVAAEDAARIRQDLAINVHEAYYSLVSALENRAVAEQNLARAQDHLRLAQDRKAAGAVPQADVVRAQVEVADAKLSLVRAENLVRISRGSLNTAMGLPVEMPIQVAAKPEKVLAPTDNLAKAFDQAVHHRPELKAGLHRIAAARHGVDAAKSAYGPKIKTEALFGWRDSRFLMHDQEWLAGVFLEQKLFTGFSRTHKVARSKAELSKEEAEIARLVQDVRQEVWSAHSKLKESYEAVQAAEVLVVDARESMRLAHERYKVGAGTITDLLDAQTALARAEAKRVATQWDYHISQSVFQRSMGLLVADRRQ